MVELWEVGRQFRHLLEEEQRWRVNLFMRAVWGLMRVVLVGLLILQRGEKVREVGKRVE